MKIMNDIIKKQERKNRICTITIIVFEIITLIVDSIYSTDYFWNLNILLLFLIIVCILSIFIKETNYMRKKMVRMFVLPLLLSASLTMPYIIWKVYFPGEKLCMNTLVQTYVSYISFVSALVLGYIVYINNINKEEKQLRKNAKLLCDNVCDIDLWLIRIKHGDKVETYKKKIDWEDYYYEIYSEIGNDEWIIKSELDKLYKLVDKLNDEIERGNYDRVRHIYDLYIDSENKNTSSYNIFEVKQVIYAIENPYSRLPKPWYSAKEVQMEISRYRTKYEREVYLWINTFLNTNCISECDRTVIEPFLFDWMIKKEDIKKWIKYPNDERKLMQVIDEIILDSRRKTNELDLCWGVISCRK